MLSNLQMVDVLYSRPLLRWKTSRSQRRLVLYRFSNIGCSGTMFRPTTTSNLSLPTYVLRRWTELILPRGAMDSLFKLYSECYDLKYLMGLFSE